MPNSHNYRESTESRKAFYRANRDRIAKRNRSLIREAKDTPCADCGIKYPHYMMEFDHVPRFGEKKYNISALATSNCALNRLWNELAKCEVVCANCHQARTWFRGNQGG